ncbi:hypothetical protein OPV22_008907 [Ensete ventricosum]|uniref:Rubicon Homology domain-containing protein n=1 Tax=Ensete ventricosum TaxID=4639 RepID=A0AAV8PQ39_ENSVE|nr:hypothetical protein OPV22_008907 [Ensete ventricosum]
MEAGSPPAAPSDPFDEFFPQQRSQGSDDDDADSNSDYSSCDGEVSELERYCSANSALGSASLCSSVGNYGDLLDFSDLSGAIENSLRARPNGGVAAPWDRFDPHPPSDEGGVASPGEVGPSWSRRLVAFSDRTGSLPRITTPSRLHPASVDPPGEGKPIREVEGRQEIVSSNRKVVDFLDPDEISAGHDDGSSCAAEVYSSGNFDSYADAEARMMMDAAEDTYSRDEHSEAFGSDDLDELMRECDGLGFQCPSLYQDQPTFQSVGPSKGSIRDVDKEEDVIDVSAPSCQLHVTDQPNQNVRLSPINNPLPHEISQKGKFLPGEDTVEDQIKSMHKGLRGDICSIYNGIIADIDVDEAPEKQVFSESTPANHDTTAYSSVSAGAFQREEFLCQEHDKPSLSPSVVLNGQGSSFQIELNRSANLTDLAEEDIFTDQNKKQDAGDAYDEMVLEMEEILLDTGESIGIRSVANRGYLNHQSHHFRDGSSTASTSGTDDIYPPAHYPSRIDWVEVIGAKQKIGDVSFGERLVGVKEYTVYVLKVWSANDQWEVERRLPSQWSFVERESMKIFGNASPDVVSKRSVLIQDCLRSVLNSRYPFGFPSPLLCFLSPGKMAYSSSLLKTLVPQSLQKLGKDWNSKFSTYKDSPEDHSELGKTIPLVVDIKPRKSMQQLLELQHYTCAGCHKQLDVTKTLLGELVQTLGWRRPWFCEYTGQLFCASCHTNDTSVLPAKVLHHWDFSLYPVSQLAKAYLESIYDQPMLCVSAMNPFLLSKVPALVQVMGIRKKISAMFPYIRCPFRTSIQRGLGFRRHLLESNDFFALRDLVDLSKGAFAALPIMLETVSNKILEHITQQCLVCYDTGVPCAARQVCCDPMSLIFPFQEAEAARCGSCGSIFHKPCLAKVIICPCRQPTGATKNRSIQGHVESEEPLDELILPSNSNSASNLFSNVLLKARPDKIWRPKNRSPVILMGSLPST